MRRDLKMLKRMMMLMGIGLACSVGGADVQGLAEPAMAVLPLGSVRPTDWLVEQLLKQSDGLTGHAEELYDDIGKSDWLTGANVGKEYAWERGPYYAKGLVSLAFVLDDATLKGKARRWVDAILGSQRTATSVRRRGTGGRT